MIGVAASHGGRELFPLLVKNAYFDFAFFYVRDAWATYVCYESEYHDHNDKTGPHTKCRGQR